MLLGALPFHAFFGLALMNTRTVLGDSYFRSLDLPWVSSLLTDQHVGGGIAWGGSEIPLVVVIISLLAQWSKGDEREARRTDRRADLDDDADLTAYNAMLARFAEQDGTRPAPRRENWQRRYRSTRCWSPGDSPPGSPDPTSCGSCPPGGTASSRWSGGSGVWAGSGSVAAVRPQQPERPALDGQLHTRRQRCRVSGLARWRCRCRSPACTPCP